MFLRLHGNSTQSKLKFHHQTCSKLITYLYDTIIAHKVSCNFLATLYILIHLIYIELVAVLYYTCIHTILTDYRASINLGFCSFQLFLQLFLLFHKMLHLFFQRQVCFAQPSALLNKGPALLVESFFLQCFLLPLSL